MVIINGRTAATQYRLLGDINLWVDMWCGGIRCKKIAEYTLTAYDEFSVSYLVEVGSCLWEINT